jgi:hypothetical protein
MRPWTVKLALLLAGIVAGGSGNAAPCPGFEPGRKDLFWGDLHVHTAYSLDAFGFGTRVEPLDAYAFARGQPLLLADGKTELRLDRPLDFAAVTDHAEFLGLVTLCGVDEQGELYASSYCQGLRELMRGGDDLAPKQRWRLRERAWIGSDPRLCVQRPELCQGATISAWQQIQKAAATANDPCRFTTFNGYEWTLNQPAQLHRNILFAGTDVPELPFDAVSFPTPQALWRQLEAFCQARPGCDVLAIPHNPNLGQGLMFELETLEAEDLRRRARYEPLVEIFQTKGSSECLAPNVDDLGQDCGFELMRWRWPGVGRERIAAGYVRAGLGAGLLHFARTGLNPLQLGFVGATDSHSGAAGAVREDAWRGHQGARDLEPWRLAVSDQFTRLNPGGLTGIWAEQNTRESLFAALKRRETYATSGPRIVVRFEQVWSHDGDPCEQAQLGDAVPMGGTLGKPPTPGARPRFVVRALQDPVEGARLERVDIVKLSVVDGAVVERVVALPARDPLGDAALCRVWTDEELAADQPALWYARVLQKPTWRWSHHACQEAARQGLECQPGLDVQIQERAWTSPIWSLP